MAIDETKPPVAGTGGSGQEGLEFVTNDQLVVPPPQPPTMWLLGDDERGGFGISRESEFFNWGDVTPGLVEYPAAEPAWPDPVAREGRRTVMIEGDARPNWVEVFVFYAIDEETGSPIPSVLDEVDDGEYYRSECRGWSGERACPAVVEGEWSFEALPAEQRPDEFVIINVTWIPPVREVHGSLVSGEAYASYSFRFRNE